MKCQRERQINTVWSHVSASKKTKFIDTASRVVVARGGAWGVREMCEGGQMVQTSS